jgi:hypothetical protein
LKIPAKTFEWEGRYDMVHTSVFNYPLRILKVMDEKLRVGQKGRIREEIATPILLAPTL